MKQPSPKSSPRRWPIALALTLLTACTTAHSNACGALFTYSPEFQAQAGTELDYLKGTGEAPHIVTMMDDYHATRETIRDCK